MKKFKEVAVFVFKNRRLIGAILGSTLALLGYAEEGHFVQRLGEQ